MLYTFFDDFKKHSMSRPRRRLHQMLFPTQSQSWLLHLQIDTSARAGTAVSCVSAHSPPSPAVWPVALFVYFLLPDECTALWETSLQTAGAAAASRWFFIKSNTLSHTDDDIPRVLTCETLAVFHLTITGQSEFSAGR